MNDILALNTDSRRRGNSLKKKPNQLTKTSEWNNRQTIENLKDKLSKDHITFPRP